MDGIRGSGSSQSPAAREAARLRQIDGGIRAHELAHQLAAGGLAGPASYDYAVGPDGRRSVVGGRVRVTLTPGADPEQTVEEARRARAAALAPADPSGQDVDAAAAAASVEIRAEGEIAARERKRREAGGAPLDAVAAELFQLAAAFETGSLSFGKIDRKA